MKFDRQWRAEHHAVPAIGHMPFAGHRTQAEINGPCLVCKQDRSTGCAFSRCPKSADWVRP